MTIKCHSKTLLKTLGFCLAFTLVFMQAPLFAQAKPEVSFGEFDKAEGTKSDQPKKKRKTREATPENDEPAGETSSGPEAAKKRALPTIDEIVGAKLDALTKKLAEQQELLTKANSDLERERTLESKAFDNHAYLALSIINTAPPADYRLESTRVYLDSLRSPLARGGKRNHGLPRKEQIFFGKVSPGCHDVLVRATYVRIKNDLISRFQVNRVEKLVARQAFVAKDGHRVEIEIEGFEKKNTVANFYRGPALRFNKSVRPNFLPGAGIVSLEEVTKQGHVKIDYLTEDSSSHRLLEKSIAIDGLPVLRAATHDEAKQGNTVFDASLSEGKHRLSVTLLFAEKKWINGGANYNFRLKFERDFFVLSGQTTLVNLIGLPKGGIKSEPQNTRYARATTQILSQQDPETFPQMTCKEIEKAEKKAQNLAEAARKKAEQAEKKAGVKPPPSTPVPQEGAVEVPGVPSEPQGPKPAEGEVLNPQEATPPPAQPAPEASEARPVGTDEPVAPKDEPKPTGKGE